MNGLRLNAKTDTPKILEESSSGVCPTDVLALHAKHLPQIMDLSKVLAELRTVFEGSWPYGASYAFEYAPSNPVFSLQGDLIFSLTTVKSKAIIAAAEVKPVKKAMEKIRPRAAAPVMNSMVALEVNDAAIGPLPTPSLEVPGKHHSRIILPLSGV